MVQTITVAHHSVRDQSAVDPRLDPSKFLRLDLEDLPIPSFHRPDLVNFWYHRMLNSEWLKTAISDESERALAILDTYDSTTGSPKHGLTPQLAALITSIKRQSSLRPLREDHPHFDGGNPMSVPSNFPPSNVALNGNITIPYWQAVGPWDVDNDNDGVPDSIWVDLGDPVQQAEDGTRYKTLVSYLIVDLDSRLNVNAHGLADDIVPQMIGLTQVAPGSFQPVIRTLDDGLISRTDGTINYVPQPLSSFVPGPNLAGQGKSQLLPSGVGYGPAEISLRPLFQAPLDSSFSPTYGNRSESAPARSIVTPPCYVAAFGLMPTEVAGKYGFDPGPVIAPSSAATSGVNYQYAPDNPTNPTGDLRFPDFAAQLKFFDYPWRIDQRQPSVPRQTSWRNTRWVSITKVSPFRKRSDVEQDNVNIPPLLTDSPYELDLSRSQRRDAWGTDHEFESSRTYAWHRRVLSFKASRRMTMPHSRPTDLEKVLRGWDADAGTLPSRLWDAVRLVRSVEAGDLRSVYTAVCERHSGAELRHSPPADDQGPANC